MSNVKEYSDHRPWVILLTAFCLLLAWNYWLPAFFSYTPFRAFFGTARYGGLESDFFTFYYAGQEFLRHGNPYLLTGKYGGFIYPPISLLFFALFTFFEFGVASELWVLAYFIAFVAALWYSANSLLTSQKQLYVVLAGLLFFTSFPITYLMQWGQADLLVSSLVIIALALARSNHDFFSSTVLALATLLKGQAVVFLIYFVLFRNDWKYLLRYFAVIVSSLALSLTVIPVQFYESYLAILLGRVPFTPNSDTQSVVRYLWFLGLHQLSPLISGLGILIFAAFAFWSGRRILSYSVTLRESRLVLAVDGMFLLNVLVMLQFNPRSAYYEYVWVILPFALYLSGVILNHAKSWYLFLVTASGFMMNSVVLVHSASQNTYYRFPYEILGNLILTVCLVYLIANQKLRSIR